MSEQGRSEAGGEARTRRAAVPAAADWRSRLPRRLHWFLFAAVAALLYFGIFRRFRIVRVETPTLRALEVELEDARLVIDRDPPHALPRDSLVWWEHETVTQFSRVVGVPGDRFLVEGDAERWMRRSEDGSSLRFAPEVRFVRSLAGRLLGPAEYVLLADQASSPWPDSRSVGVVARAAIRFRVMFRL